MGNRQVGRRHPVHLVASGAVAGSGMESSERIEV